jgi:hypothetical protein
MRKQILCALAFLIGLSLVASCSGRAPERSFKTRDLMIDLSVFPSDWQVTVLPGPTWERYGQIASCKTEFVASEDPLIGAIHTVFRYKSERAAAARFDRMEPSWFNSSSIASATPWRTPGQLPYESPIADKSRFACHDSDVGGRATICQFMAQYDEYLVIFHTVMTPGDMQPQSYMTFADLERILKAIDELMLLHLGRVEE